MVLNTSGKIMAKYCMIENNRLVKNSLSLNYSFIDSQNKDEFFTIFLGQTPGFGSMMEKNSSFISLFIIFRRKSNPTKHEFKTNC